MIKKLFHLFEINETSFGAFVWMERMYVKPYNILITYSFSENLPKIPSPQNLRINFNLKIYFKNTRINFYCQIGKNGKRN